jgi:hypothetical protein
MRDTSLASGVTADERLKIGRSLRVPITDDNVRLALTDASHNVHLAATSDSICLGVRETSGAGSLGCAEAGRDDGTHPLVSVSSIPGGQTRTTMLVADGISEVTVAVSGGNSQVARVSNNVVDFVTAGPPKSITWTTANGAAGSLTPAG